MPNRLILLRHAEAADTGQRTPDFERPLTPAGRIAAAEVGRWLAKRGPAPDEILCSAATRTRETWAAVAEELTDPPPAQFSEALYHAGAENMLSALPHMVGTTLLIIGHQPGIGQLAALLPDNFPEDPLLHRFPPATALVIEFAAEDWTEISPGQGRVADYYLPSRNGVE